MSSLRQPDKASMPPIHPTPASALHTHKSLRLRLVLGLSLTLCVLWGGVAAWMFPTMQRELRELLDNRLVTSAKMVAGLVEQFQNTQDAPLSPHPATLQAIVGRDGVACEVSLVRSEVDIIPLARTHNSPDFPHHAASGFSTIQKGGKPWRSYVLIDNGVRIATADRLDVREQLVSAFLVTLIVPFALALVGVVLLSWWITSWCLRPLQQLGQALQQRPPQDASPVQAGQDTPELAPLVASLNDLLGRIDDSLERERRWTADAAHELRTPLTAIKTHVQVAQLVLQRSAEHGAQPTQAQTALLHAHSGIEHLHATLDQLLQLARLEKSCDLSGPDAHTQGASIAAAIHRAAQQSQQRAASYALTCGQTAAPLHIDIAPPLQGNTSWQLPLPAALLTCAVTNLLDNALRHHQGPNAVTLRVHVQLADSNAPTNAQLHIHIQDHGPGMTEQECAQASQRFWRKSSSTSGSGLGLTIVQRIAHSAGGSLQLAPAHHGAAHAGLAAILVLPLHMAALKQAVS